MFFATLAAAMAFASPDLALVGAKIYPSPTSPAIAVGTIVLHGGRIVSVGPTGRLKIPKGAEVIDCKGLVVTAGFWNSHVHILTEGLLHAAKLLAASLSSQLEQMLTRYGFTTVFDIASVLGNTNDVRRRVASGEVRGPRILTVGEPFYPKGGTPVYVLGFLTKNHIDMPETDSAALGVARVRQRVASGADGIKIFSASFTAKGILPMPQAIASAIVAEAHRLHKPVFAHPSNLEGIGIALNSGVDVLAHTAPVGGPWSQALVRRMVDHHMALIPTLSLFDVEGKKSGEPEAETRAWIAKAVSQLKAFHAAGGQVLFGTDVGYTDLFDTREEFQLMAAAGLNFRQILATLTTNPAKRFGFGRRTGRIAPGMDADLVVLQADPAKHVTAFAKVQYTIRAGRIIYQRAELPVP